MSEVVTFHVDWTVSGTGEVGVTVGDLTAAGISMEEVLENPAAAFKKADGYYGGDLRYEALYDYRDREPLRIDDVQVQTPDGGLQ